jgi:hypothetical protein
MAGLVPPTRAEALWEQEAPVASAGEGAAIHVFVSLEKSWMPGTRPGMTIFAEWIAL